MRKKTNGWLALLICLVAAVGLFAACGKVKDDTIELFGFDVPEEDTAAFGSVYNLKDYAVTDADGNVYVPSVKVTVGDEEVQIFSGGFQIRKVQDHLITYTIKVGEQTFVKTTTVKVADRTEPIVTLGEYNPYIDVGTVWTPPTATVLDDADTGLIATVEVYSGQTKVEPTGGTYTFATAGLYTLKASSTDSAGNTGTAEATLYVRNKAATGEIEAFADAFSPAAGSSTNLESVDYGFTDQAVGGESPAQGRYFFRFSSNEKGSDKSVTYPGFTIVPRMTKEDANGFSIAGRDAQYVISFRIYQTSTVNRYVYYRWNGAQKRVETPITPNTWTTVTLPINDLVASYEAVADGKQMFMYFSNDPLYIKQETFDAYVTGIWVTQEADVSFGTSFGNGSYLVGDTLDLTDLGLQAELNDDIVEADYSLIVTAPSGAKTAITDQTSITLSEFGDYTVTANLIGNDRITGSAIKRIHVGCTLASVKKFASDLNAEADKTTDAFVEKLMTLKEMYESLNKDDVISYTRIDMMRDVFDLDVVDNRLLFADTRAGLLQIVMNQTSQSEKNVSPFGGDLYYDSIRRHEDEAGSIGFTTAESLYYVSFKLGDVADGIGNIRDYESMTFYVYAEITTSGADAYPNNKDKWNIRAFNGLTEGNFDKIGQTYVLGQSTPAGSGEWVKVTVNLAAFDNWDDIYIAFHAADWSRFLAGSKFWISAVDAVPQMSLAFDPLFLADDYYVGDALDANAGVATAKYKNQAVTEGITYTVTTPDGQTVAFDPTAEYRFAAEGEYTFTVSGSGVLAGLQATKSVTVKEKVLSAEAQAFDAAVLEAYATMNKTTPEYAQKLGALQTQYAALSETDKQFIDYHAYQKVLLNAEEVIAFDRASGIKDVTYNITYGNEVVIDGGGVPTYTTDIPEGLPAEYGLGATKFSPTERLYQIMLDFTDKTAALGDIRRYQSITFYVYRDSDAKFLVRGRTIHDYYSNQTVSDLAGRTWNKVTIDLARFNAWDDIRLWLVDNTWNPVDPTVYYVSSIFASTETTVELDIPNRIGAGEALRLPQTATVVNGAQEHAATSITYTAALGDGTPETIQTGHVFTTAGLYTISMQIALQSGEVVVVKKTLEVIAYNTDGNLFTAENADLMSTGSYGTTPVWVADMEIGGRTGGGIKLPSTANGTAQKYPGMYLPVCMTKEALQEMYDAGARDISFDVYLDYDEALDTGGDKNYRYFYIKWSGSQVNVGWAYVKEWTTITIKGGLQSLIDNYDTVVSGAQEFLYVGNDNQYTGDKKTGEFDTYFMNIKVVQATTGA